jgi:TonB family protein
MKGILFVLLLISGFSYGQEEVFVVPDEEPTFPGGMSDMQKWIATHVEYPEKSIENGEQGIVYVQFVVRIDGSITDVKVIRGVSELLDAEAIRVVKLMPKWNPAEKDGKKINCQYTLPIKFVNQK